MLIAEEESKVQLNKKHILLLLLFLNEEDNVYCGGKLEKTSL